MRRSSANSCRGRRTPSAASSASTTPSPKAASRRISLAWCTTSCTTGLRPPRRQQPRGPLARDLSFDDSKPEGGEPTYIVGLVHDILHDGLKTTAKSTVYVPFRENAFHIDPMLLVRAQLPPASLLPAIRREIGRVDLIGR